MKLYSSPGSCSSASDIALREAGLNFDVIKVDLATKKYGANQDFNTINPKGYVPVLELDNGERLTENVAILQWIADHAPKKNLAPTYGTQERYHLIEWLGFISTEIHKTFSPLFAAAKSGQPLPERNLELLKKRLAYVNDHLSHSAFLMGDHFSVADCYLYVVTTWTQYMKIDISHLKGLTAFQDRMSQRESVKKALS